MASGDLSTFFVCSLLLLLCIVQASGAGLVLPICHENMIKGKFYIPKPLQCVRHNTTSIINCSADVLIYYPSAGLGKIDYNRYSIAIFLTLFQSNTPDPLLFGMSIEYAVFFSFFQVKTIFDFFFSESYATANEQTLRRGLLINYISGVLFPIQLSDF